MIKLFLKIELWDSGNEIYIEIGSGRFQALNLYHKFLTNLRPCMFISSLVGAYMVNDSRFAQKWSMHKSFGPISLIKFSKRQNPFPKW